TAAGKSFNVMRIIGRIAQRLSQSVHGGADAVLKFDDGVVRPKPLTQLFAGHYLARALEQHDQNSKRVLGQANSFSSILAQLTGTQVELEILEENYFLAGFGFRHGTYPKACRIVSLSKGVATVACPAPSH